MQARRRAIGGRLALLGMLFAMGAVEIGAAPSPMPQGKNESKTRFVVYGDTRDGHAMHRKIVALILAQKPAFVLQTGDLVHYGPDAGLWKIYDDITGAMRRALPVYPARGNHDVGGTGYEARVTSAFTSGNRLYYSFTRGPYHFVSVDSFSPHAPGSPQYVWLAQDLAQAQKKGQPTFVYFHVPPYSIGTHGSSEDAQTTLCPLFVKYQVALVFNGHDHLYYRTRRNGVSYVVTGGGGAPLYPAHPDRGAIAGDKWESVNHIVVCDLRGETLTGTVLRADGSLLERFAIALKSPPTE